jgi:hypothetical protein
MGGHRRVGQGEESGGGVVGGHRESRWRKKAVTAAFEVAEAAWTGLAERRWSSRTGGLGRRARDGEGGAGGVGGLRSVALATNE